MPATPKRSTRKRSTRSIATASSPPDAKPVPEGEIIDMEQAIAMLRTSQPTFYRWLREGKVKGMKVGRQWRFYRQDIDRFMKGQGPRIDLPADIDPLLDRLGRLLKEQGVEPAPAGQDNGQGKLSAAVRRLIRLGIAMRASDIHIDPPTQPGQQEVQVRLRLDGVLRPVVSVDARLLPAVVEQLKVMAALDPHERARPQDGRINASEEALDLRVSFVPALLGEAATLRLLPREGMVFDLERLGFAAHDLQRMLRALQHPWGLIVCTGPTGSGKTTVLYSMFQRKIVPELKVMSVEDPVEFSFPGAVQAQVRPDAGATFASVLRSFARSDPDVIMVGEVRDREVMGLNQMLALTGHLVLTTLHTDDAASALRRMIDLSGQPALVGDSTRIVVAQRLVRRLCTECSVEQEPQRPMLEQAERAARTGGVSWEALPKRFRSARGCARCNQMGYRGRRVIAEVLEMTDEIASALRRGASVDELRTMAVGQGMTTIAADGVRRAAEGETTIEEVLRVIPRQV